MDIDRKEKAPGLDFLDQAGHYRPAVPGYRNWEISKVYRVKVFNTVCDKLEVQKIDQKEGNGNINMGLFAQFSKTKFYIRKFFII